MWDFLEKFIISSAVIISLSILWIGTQEFSKRYKKNHPNDIAECKKEITECMSCGIKDICSKKIKK